MMHNKCTLFSLHCSGPASAKDLGHLQKSSIIWRCHGWITRLERAENGNDCLACLVYSPRRGRSPELAGIQGGAPCTRAPAIGLVQ